MVAAPVVEVDPRLADDPVLADIEAFADRLRLLADQDQLVGDPGRVERIAALERLRSTVVAAQAAEMVRFGRGQVTRQLDDPRFDPERVGKGVVDQVALACRISPTEGARRLAAARAWVVDLPETFRLLASGRLHERVAQDVVRETRHLDPVGQGAVDRAVADSRVERLGCRAAKAAVAKAAYDVDPAAYVQRGRTERRHRRVTLRPAPDTMSWLSGYLPVEQGVACWAALRKAADTAQASGDDRSRDQVMADTLVERLTGQAAATDVNIEIQIVMPLDNLTEQPEQPEQPVTLTGHGWLPAPIARDILNTSKGRLFWRRLFTAPADPYEPDSSPRTVVGGDRRRRRFTAFLRMLILARDQTCRVPYCDAPIRQFDHITNWASGGANTLDNGQGLCQHHNLTKELPGWTTRLVRPDVSVIRTPTGHHYAARAPDPP